MLGTNSVRPVPVRTIAEKTGFLTTPNSPEVTRVVRSLGSTPMRQDVPMAPCESSVRMIPSMARVAPRR